MRPHLLIVIFATLCIQSGNSLDAKTSILKYFGSITWQANSGEKAIKCRATDADPMGEFEWRLGDKSLRIQGEPEEIGENEYEHILNYQPKIEDDGKVLVCRYKQMDDFGEIIHEADSDELKFIIELSKFPQSPFQAGQHRVGQPVEFSFEFELYPDPNPNDVLWVVQGTNQDDIQKFKPGESDKSKKYKAGELKSLGPHKYSTSFSIASVDQGDDEKEHYLLVKGSDAKRTEHRTDVEFVLTSVKEPMPTEPAEESTEKGEPVEEGQKPAQMNIGIIIILVLVILIIVICIGYCIYKRYNKKPEPRDQPPQDVRKDGYQPTATSEPTDHAV